MATATVTEKAPRTVELLARPGDEADGRLLVTEGTACELYYLRELPTDLAGRAWRVEKHGSAPDEGYDVLVAAEPRDSTCCCKGWTYRGHRKPCRHLAALMTLISRRLI